MTTRKNSIRGTRWLIVFLTLITVTRSSGAAEPTLRDRALATMKKAAMYYCEKVAVRGGYVYYYSQDLQQRWGEGKVGATTIVVQPPATPTVGMAYLRAYASTEDKFFLQAAKDTAEALVYGQLQSGGWTQVIDFAPARRMGMYRNGKGGSWNASSLDDGQTQAALTFLSRIDHVLQQSDPTIHEATNYGLNALLAAQFPNGAFPQVWTKPITAPPNAAPPNAAPPNAAPPNAAPPNSPARFPNYDWRTEQRSKNYWDLYTLNDNLAGSVSKLLIEAHQLRQEQRYLESLRKLGDFLLLAQMPEPQPGWCQQYTYTMHPAWARKFEPPAISGSESQDVMETLLRIADYTGDSKYRESIARSLRYFSASLLPDGKLARFYELRTNKPLYMNRRYELTHDDTDLPSHYGWKISSRLGNIAKELRRQQSASTKPQPKNSKHSASTVDTADSSARGQKRIARLAQVERIVAQLDEQGRWIDIYNGDSQAGQPGFSRGFPFLSSQTFCRNLEILSEYVAATAPQGKP